MQDPDEERFWNGSIFDAGTDRDLANAYAETFTEVTDDNGY